MTEEQILKFQKILLDGGDLVVAPDVLALLRAEADIRHVDNVLGFPIYTSRAIAPGSVVAIPKNPNLPTSHYSFNASTQDKATRSGPEAYPVH